MLVPGRFSGLDVWGADGDCPLILTTVAKDEAVFLMLIDISGDVHIQMVPLSVITSDVLPFSQITDLSINQCANEVFLCDDGLKRVIKVDLLEFSCCLTSQFPQNIHILGCVALPAKLIVAVQMEGKSILYSSDHNSSWVKQEICAFTDKLHKLGLVMGNPVVLRDDGLETILFKLDQ
eukprot:GFUD01138249.1.p1 GENE.GFUD01138249.1~~GFUD01138249.1.p1  ORF type:complete len:178 (+),score=36.01 GFUD01138249.1:314-847(+)